MANISKIQLKNKEGLIIDENIMLDYNIIAIYEKIDDNGKCRVVKMINNA